MKNIKFERAERKQSHILVGLIGASGSGKTFSALKMADGMKQAELVKKVCMIDTEGGSGSLYDKLTEYDTARLDAPFSPERYQDYIASAVSQGYDLIIIDSLSPAWEGVGGVLEIKDEAAAKMKNDFAAWGQATPKHNRLIQSIVGAQCHFLITFRTRIEHSVETGSDGKTKIRKLGTKPIQRDAVEYELTLSFDIDEEHKAVSKKDRTMLFDGKPSFTISEDTGIMISNWVQSGADPYEISKTLLDDMLNVVNQIDNLESLNEWYFTNENNINMLEQVHRDELIALCKKRKDEFSFESPDEDPEND